mgnify:CR=1 FL=1
MSEWLIFLLLIIGVFMMFMWAFNPALAWPVVAGMALLFIIALIAYAIRAAMRRW